MKNNTDRARKWMWWFLAALTALQLYWVRELLVALAMFTVGFGALAIVVASIYLARTGWDVAAARLARSSAPGVDLTVGVKANQKAG